MLKELINVFHRKPDRSDPDISGVLALIQGADEIPSTERIEALKTEFIELCLQAQTVFEKQDPQNRKILSLEALSRSGREQQRVDWFVVGDLHCDFRSLCRLLLKIYLRPNVDPAKVKIIFLGDYIDRGNRPFEVLKLLLSLKTRWPDHFWLLRGNHETLIKGEDGIVLSSVTPADTIDFWKEHYGEEVFVHLAELFDRLPVAFIQPVDTAGLQGIRHDQNIFYVHGGIPRTEDLLRPLHSPECQAAFLWSDPELEKEDVLNGPGRRFSFGRKDFLTFASHHSIALMVRGHEVRKDGFDLHPELKSTDRQIVTIHSCGGTENEDSHYASEILVPRFLHMSLDDSFNPGFSVEEVYRDDLLVSGSLFAGYPEYFKNLAGCLGSFSEYEIGVNLNIQAQGDLSIDEDPSNLLDRLDFYVWLRLRVGTNPDEIEYQININRYMLRGSFPRNPDTISGEMSELIDLIRNVYPIYGRTSTNYFNTLKEDPHG